MHETFFHIIFSLCAFAGSNIKDNKQVIITEGGSVDLLNFITENVCSHMTADPKRGNIFLNLSPYVGKVLFFERIKIQHESKVQPAVSPLDELKYVIHSINIMAHVSTDLYLLVVKAR